MPWSGRSQYPFPGIFLMTSYLFRRNNIFTSFINHKHIQIFFLALHNVQPTKPLNVELDGNTHVKTLCMGRRSEETLGFVDQLEVKLDVNTYSSVMEACTNLDELKRLYTHMKINGITQNCILGTKLVRMFLKFRSLEEARRVFDDISDRNVLTWNAMIRGYARLGLCKEALDLYYQMKWSGIQPDNFTFPEVLKACAGLLALREGMEIHDDIVRCELELNPFVGSALIYMYAKCERVEIARQVFDKICKRDVALWSAMIAGYTQNGWADEALRFFHQMQQARVNPNLITFGCVLAACSALLALRAGQAIHGHIIRGGLTMDLRVETALVDMYAKCGRVDIACKIFDRMCKRDVVSWSVMIAGYTQNGNANEALSLFREMELAGVNPNQLAIVSVLPACAELAALQEGEDIHEHVVKNGLESNVSVVTTLVDFYSKCGKIEVARQLFDKMSEKDVVLWNTMISGYSRNGYANEALTLFRQMQLSGITPDSVAMASILPACACLGALQEGRQMQGYIIRSGFQVDVSVGNALIHMYAKCGQIGIAQKVFERMPIRDVVSWNTMITGHVHNGYADEALDIFNQMLFANVKPNRVTIVSVLPACAELAALQQGKDIHRYSIENGFESDVSVMTGLVDMYVKCGCVHIARRLFDRMSERDVALWNVMIAGYGLHGQGEDAIALFFQMQQLCMKPDHITFVCILSACSHAGLVDEGRQCFNCMTRDYGYIPTAEHYACMVDLLGRAGHLNEAEDFIQGMPSEPDARVWGALLGACRIHCAVKLGERISEHLFELEPENVGNYMLLSNIYAEAGRWDDVAKVRAMLRGRQLKKLPGCSWIEVGNRVHTFVTGDTPNPQTDERYATL